MGYELNRLMRLYGVANATAPAYTGTSMPSGSAGSANPQYQTELANYNSDMAKFKDYQSQYAQQLNSGNMYNMGQFNAGLPGNYSGVGADVLKAPVYANVVAATGKDAAGNPVSSGGATQGQIKTETTPTGEVRNYTPRAGTLEWIDIATGTPNQATASDFRAGETADVNGTRYVVNTHGQWEMVGPTPGYTNPTAPTQAPVPNTAPAASTSATSYMQNTPTVPDLSKLNLPYNFLNTYKGNAYSGDNVIQNMYAKGGQVKTNFAIGGINDLATTYDVTAIDPYQYGPRPSEGPLGPWFEEVVTETIPGVRVSGRARTPERNRQVGGDPKSYHLSDDARDFTPPEGMSLTTLGRSIKDELGPGYDVVFNSPGHYDHVHVEPGPGLRRGTAPARANAGPTPAAEVAPPVAVPDRLTELNAILGQYGPDQDVYGPELAAARGRVKEESDAFRDMLAKAMESPEDAKMSKAEMYFRLASAFGSPTKTGQFTENLALAGKEMGEYSKSRRESAQNKLALRIKGQEMRMGAAKEELGTLRALASEEMKDRRAMAQQLIKDYIDSGKPQSSAGKQALDEGLTPGTPAFQERVREISTLDIQQQMAQIQASLAGVQFATRREEREERKEQRLTGPEITMKRETEDAISSADQALKDLSQAYALNPNTFDASLVDTARRKALEAAGSKDPKLLNTRTLENLLGQQALERLKSTFGSAPTEGERAILMDLQGIGSKSIEERAAIMRRAYQATKARRDRYQTRLRDITSGAYRTVSGE